MRHTLHPCRPCSVHGFRPAVEVLEAREAPAVFTVAAGDVATLIADVNLANANGQANTINLSPSVFNFTAPDNFWYGPNALPAISSDLTINGSGAFLVRQGTTPFRFFYV